MERKLTSKIILLIILIFCYNISFSQFEYWAVFYTRMKVYDAPLGARFKKYDMESIFRIRLNDNELDSFLIFCQGRKFETYYMLYRSINPDSFRTIEMYEISENKALYASLAPLFKNERKVDIERAPITHRIEIDSGRAISTEHILLLYKTDSSDAYLYKSNTIFKDSLCTDPNRFRAHLRRIDGEIVDCPEYYGVLRWINCKIKSTLYFTW